MRPRLTPTSPAACLYLNVGWMTGVTRFHARDCLARPLVIGVSLVVQADLQAAHGYRPAGRLLQE